MSADKKEKTSLDQNLEMARKLAEEGRIGDWITKGMILQGVISLILIVLVVVYWKTLIDSLSDWLMASGKLIQNQNQATLVANYLLATLIAITIVVEFIPYLVNWFNRPKIILASIDHSHNGYLRIKYGNQPESRKGVSIITASVTNNGRGAALRPVINIAHTDFKISSVVPSTTEASTVDKSITILPATLYQFTGDYDELAIQFVKRGMKTIEYIPGRRDGKRVILGFAFEGGDSFYFASLDSAFLDKVKLGATNQLVSLSFYARNSKKKILKTNIPAAFQSWNAVKFDYRRIEGPPPENKS